jgi:hypothetical protein
MIKFTANRTNSKTHPWRVEMDGIEVALCWSKNIAQLIAETLEHDNRHQFMIGECQDNREGTYS